MNIATHLVLSLALLLSVQCYADKVDDYVQGEMEKQHIPGLSLAVLRSGETIKCAAYGLANIEANLPARPETVFQLQSITKTFTATAVMMLVEEGKIGLDDKVTKYVEGLPACCNEITVRHLLSHTSGVKDFINEPTVDLRKDISAQRVVKSLVDLPLNFAPGEKYSYSNTGYHLLGMIIHKVTDKLWHEFVKERIFDPLGMNDTRVISLSHVITNRAEGYVWENDRLQNGHFVAPTILAYAGGGMRSTILDMTKWDAALYTEKLLKHSTLEQMWISERLNNGSKAGYGFGWAVGEFRGHRLVSHTGSHMTGFKTAILRFLDDKLTVVVLTNQRAAEQVKIGQGVAAMYFE